MIEAGRTVLPSCPIIKEGKIVNRLNRFVVSVEIHGEIDVYYLPNPGRMHELIWSGSRVYIQFDGKHRKTKGTVIAAMEGQELVSLDSRLPNTLFREAITSKEILEFKNYKTLKAVIEPFYKEITFQNQTDGVVIVFVNFYRFGEIKPGETVKKNVPIYSDFVTIIAKDTQGKYVYHRFCNNVSWNYREKEWEVVISP